MLYRRPFTERPVAEIDLGHPGFLRLSRARGARIETLSGVVLITFQGVLEDIELCCGASIIVPNDDLALLEGFEACRIRLTHSHMAVTGQLASLCRHWMQTVLSREGRQAAMHNL